MDPLLASSADHEQIATFVQIALLCAQPEPQLRPDMDRVVVVLSRKPGHLEEPIRPGVPGSRYRRYRTGTGSVTGNSDVSTSGFSGSTKTRSASLTVNTSSLDDPRGKRPLKD